MDHPGESVAWGRWAITSNDPDFRGKGSQDSGDDYGPAPGTLLVRIIQPLQESNLLKCFRLKGIDYNKFYVAC